MLQVHRLGGPVFALNPDLIERAEATPDTVVTLVDGNKYVIQESLDELVDAIRAWRSEVIAIALSMGNDNAAPITAGPNQWLAREPSPHQRHSGSGNSGQTSGHGSSVVALHRKGV
ncbi:flagellar protein FlbD [Frankineae bacterium MT45]|nr:flagellar protein FlbD [Frankineae bacterium MT45]